ncbi:transposase [Gluconacetobacter sacchari DSM 12717]|uniref:Transposase n=1 Tax=Gluconacetobacter sacchari DSM 12717 TaxID=1307940 RepID=A0ABQ0P3W9_9PROT|nr:transposase [Gluconacetobacter sacchari DSM 12717]
MLPRKAHVGKHVHFRPLHEFRQFRKTFAQHVRDVPPLARCVFGGFNHAHIQRRQRVLGGLSLTAKVAERLQQRRCLRNRSYKATNGAGIMNDLDRIMLYANDVSQSYN